MVPGDIKNLDNEEKIDETCNEKSPFTTNEIDFNEISVPSIFIQYENYNEKSSNLIYSNNLKKSSKLSEISLNRKKECKRIRLNIGGQIFITYKSTLKLMTQSRLANLTETNSDYDRVKKEYFFDRDPNSFIAILNYFRTGHLHTPQNVCGNLFYGELKFWGIDEREIQPCCWTNFSNQRECYQALNKVIGEIELNDSNYDHIESWKLSGISSDLEMNKSGLSRARSSFKDMYEKSRGTISRFLNDRNSSLAAYVHFWVSVIILCVSILVFIMMTSTNFRTPVEIAMNTSLTRKQRQSLTTPFEWLYQIEMCCNAFFIIEFFSKFLSSPNKCKFLRNPYNYLEFLACTPIIAPTKIHDYIEVFYILRILKIFILVPKYSGLKVLLLTIKSSLGELLIYFFMLLMTILIFASFIYYAEQVNEKDDNKFDSIFISLYWAVVTITTLGYGDLVPTTPLGYIIGGLCALTGLVFLAMPIPVIVNNFTTFYAHAKARQKLEEVSSKLKGLPNRALALNVGNNFTSSESIEVLESVTNINTKKVAKISKKKIFIKNRRNRVNEASNIFSVQKQTKRRNAFQMQKSVVMKQTKRRNALGMKMEESLNNKMSLQ